MNNSCYMEGTKSIIREINVLTFLEDPWVVDFELVKMYENG